MSLETENKTSGDHSNVNKTQIDVTKLINSNDVHIQLIENPKSEDEKCESDDESLKERLSLLIQKLDLNELRADLINQSGIETVSLKDETWNVYCKLCSLYSLEVIYNKNLLKTWDVKYIQIMFFFRMTNYNG